MVQHNNTQSYGQIQAGLAGGSLMQAGIPGHMSYGNQPMSVSSDTSASQLTITGQQMSRISTTGLVTVSGDGTAFLVSDRNGSTGSARAPAAAIFG